MANETMVTIQGWIANAPMGRDVNGTPVLNFRVGCTPRHYSKATAGWVDGETQWYAVSAWRRLATHAERSLKQGDPVIVHGRLNHRTYTNNAGVDALSVEIEAFTIGHDLTRGATTFLKAPPTTELVRPVQDGADFGPEPDDPWVVPPTASEASDVQGDARAAHAAA